MVKNEEKMVKNEENMKKIDINHLVTKESNKKTKLANLDIEEQDKELLAKLVNPMTIAEVAAKINRCYASANQLLLVWAAKKWLVRHRSRTRKVFYILNREKIEL